MVRGRERDRERERGCQGAGMLYWSLKSYKIVVTYFVILNSGVTRKYLIEWVSQIPRTSYPA